MTQNLRTKTYADGVTTLTQGANTDPTSKFYNYPGGNETTFIAHPEYGLLYTWVAATGRTDIDVDGANNANQTHYQGICPDGWVIPNDYDWNQLEKVIAESAIGEYSTTAPIAWNTSYSTAVGYRGTHGTKMKSPTKVIYTTDGTSKDDGTGFNALLVGYLDSGGANGYGSYTYFWSGSTNSDTAAWRRYLHYNGSGVDHYFYSKYYLFSVRCKKQ
jgi:uncharacterized protein (TIGR02145 family)